MTYFIIKFHKSMLFYFKIVLFSLLLPVSFTHAAVLQGKVIHVSDGDTVDVLAGKETIRIRLDGIDAPETRQAWGTRSRDALRQLVYQQRVEVITGKKDRYGRVLGTIIKDGLNVNLEMVRMGMAWVYRQYSQDLDFLVAEAEAREQKRGLWQDKQPVAPWDYRRLKREQAGRR